VIRIEALPARDGDCLWVQWEHEARTHRMLIDGGRGDTAARRIAALPPGDRHVDLVVCTHIDADHIEGVLHLFENAPDDLTAGDVWFNGQRHLRPRLSGALQGTRLEQVLGRRRWPWNRAFHGGAVSVPDTGKLPVLSLPGLTLTLLAPRRADLARLDKTWAQVLKAYHEKPPLQRGPDPDAGKSLAELAGLVSTPDTSPANGSSIAFLAEHAAGGRVLFTADAPTEPLLAGLRRLAPGGTPVPVDLCKVPHHGSHHNVSSELVAALDCGNWLLSTNGARHRHPDRRAIARIIAGSPDPTLWFNYHGPTTDQFKQPTAGYRSVHPAPGRAGMTLEVSAGRVHPAPPGDQERSVSREAKS
jgi:hypothetical protein